MSSRALARSGAAVLALLGSFLLAGGTAGASQAAATPTTAQMAGQRLIVAFSGTTAKPPLLARIRAGQVGGVILFGGNIRSAAQLRRLTARLQRAARAGGRPRLLIATDQEGGLVRRLPWAPPKASAQQLGATSAAHVQAVGHRAGSALRAAGVNLDLAPVADVPSSPSNFLRTQHRAFSDQPLHGRDGRGRLRAGARGGARPAGPEALPRSRPGGRGLDRRRPRHDRGEPQADRERAPALPGRPAPVAPPGRHALDGRLSGVLAQGRGLVEGDRGHAAPARPRVQGARRSPTRSHPPPPSATRPRACWR